MLFKILMQKNPAYDESSWREQDILYEGGIRAMRAARDFIKPLDGEKAQRYEDRIRLVAYIGYVAQVIDFFCAALFSSGLDVTEAADADDEETEGEPAQESDFWRAFAKDADRKGLGFSSVMREAVRCALLKKRALVACDFPDPGVKPTSRLEEKQLGADRGYCYNLDLEKLVDWELDDEGKLDWAILYEKNVERPSPKAERKLETHCWTIWTRGTAPDIDPTALRALDEANESGDVTAASNILRTLQKKADAGRGDKARWERYEFTCPIGWNDFRPDLDIPKVDEGETSFLEIPILVLELPAGLWAGNFLGPMAVEHWSRRSALVGAEARNMTATTFVSLGKDDGGLGADVLDDATKRALRDRGVDVVVPGTMGVAEPMATAYDVIQRDLKDLKDEIFRVAHQMAMSVDNTAGSMKRSGESKQQDKKDVDVVLGALAVFVKTFAVRIYGVLAAAMGETDVVWTPRGLDKFVGEDRAELTQEGINLEIISDAIPSPTWQKETKTQFALRWTPNLDPTTQDTIRMEIAAGVDVHQELKDAQLDLEKDQVENTPTPKEQMDAKNEALAKATSGAPPAERPPPAPGTANKKAATKTNGKAKTA